MNQKVRGQGQVLDRHLTQTQHPRRTGETSPTRVHLRNVVNLSSSRKGKLTVRKADGWAGRGRWKKRRPSRNQADRGCNLSPRESGLTSIGSFFTRELGEPIEKARHMTAELSQTAGAAFHAEVDWQAVDWQTAHRNVRRLQASIVKAMQAGRWGKVKALQRLLTHSFSAKVLAVKRVTENQGKRTPGVDGEIWDTPTKKVKSIAEVELLQSRVPRGAFEGLELHDGKLSRAVLRGRGGGNAALLPGVGQSPAPSPFQNRT